MVVVNSQTERMFGYHREELLGKKVEVLMAQRVRRQHVKNRAAFLKHPGTRTMGSGLELYGLRKDLTEFPVDVSLSQVETAGGMLVSSHIRDITERKRAEELASHLASIVEASDDAIFVRSLDGTIVSWNSGAERLYGYKAEEVVGRPVALLVPPDRADELGWIMKGLRRGKHIEHYETTRVHKDGHRIDISVTVSPVRDRAGAVVGASVIARDITDRKRVEMALRQSEERFRVALKTAPVRVFNQDLELRLHLDQFPRPGLGKARLSGQDRRGNRRRRRRRSPDSLEAGSPAHRTRGTHRSRGDRRRREILFRPGGGTAPRRQRDHPGSYVLRYRHHSASKRACWNGSV